MFCCLKRYETGQCSVCLKNCSTKSCNCTFLHKECSRKIVKNFGPKCSICKKYYSIWFLQSEPEDTEEDKTLIKKTKIQRTNFERIEKNTIKYNLEKYSYSILSAYPFLYLEEDVDIQILLNDIAMSENIKKSIYQQILNNGYKDYDANNFIVFLIGINNKYSVMSKKIKKYIKHVLVKHLKNNYKTNTV